MPSVGGPIDPLCCCAPHAQQASCFHAKVAKLSAKDIPLATHVGGEALPIGKDVTGAVPSRKGAAIADRYELL